MPNEIVGDEYTTEIGVKVRLRPVRDVLVQAYAAKAEQEFREAGKLVDVPTYQVTNIAGEVINLPLDEESLEDPKDPAQTARNKAAWRQYADARAALEDVQGERRFMAWLMLGVDCEVPDDGWEDEAKLFGLTVSEEPLERKAQWLLYRVLTPFDRAMLIPHLQMVAAGKMVTPEQLELFRETAEHSLEDRARDLIDTAIASIRQVVGEPEIPGDGGSPGLETDAD